METSIPLSFRWLFPISVAYFADALLASFLVPFSGYHDQAPAILELLLHNSLPLYMKSSKLFLEQGFPEIILISNSLI